MIKSYIYDPSVPVDVPGLKRDPTNSSLYQSHKFPEESDHISKKQGFHNLGYSTHPSTTKLDIDNNHINRLHAQDERVRTSQPESDSNRYILRPEDKGMPVKVPPVLCDEPMLGTGPFQREESFRDSGLGSGGILEGSDGYPFGQEEDYEEMRCNAASTTDTADEESILSLDMQTSTTSLSSADTKLVTEDRDDKELSFMSEEQEIENENDGVSFTDSMVAEALAALDAATEGEDYE